LQEDGYLRLVKVVLQAVVNIKKMDLADRIMLIFVSKRIKNRRAILLFFIDK